MLTIMLIKWLIKKIISMYLAIAKLFVIWITKYTTSFIVTIITVLLSLLTLKHCKFGLFVKCEDYTYNNNFNKDSRCKVLQVKIKEDGMKKVENLYD